MSPRAEKDPLSRWIALIRDQEMPIFGYTVQQVVNVAEDDEAPASDLARVVLQDASMTARVLKLANSPYFNPRRQGISTVSRAVVILGFDTVRAMCLTITLVDSFVQGEPREQLIHELARAIHGAVQARTIAIQRGDDSPEEVFVATLLYHVGELAFWCFGGEHAGRLLETARQPGYTAEAAEEEVLGFRLRRLTKGLVAEWQLNTLLKETLRDPRQTGDRGRNVDLSYRLAVAAEKGWDDPEVQSLTRELAKLTGQTEREATESVHTNAREAARIANYYGAKTAAQTIPVPGSRPEEEGEEVAEAVAFPEPDGMLQLKVLRELSTLLESGKADFNLVMELTLEGMYRGIGLDRTLFALLSPDRRGLRGKYGVAATRDDLANRFQFVQDKKEQNILFAALERKQPLWVDVVERAELAPLVPATVTSVVGKAPFFIAPIVVNERVVGLFYADRAPSERPLDEESFDSFKHFTQQANIGLSHLAGRPK